jgi:UDP-MurNAc hydroxylase
MEITVLGHAGFCVETSKAIIVMDPWLSPTGAFDGSWFQFPCNHHLAAYVQEKLSNTEKQRFVYISHEHKDHYDLGFLNSIVNRNFTLVLANYKRGELREILGSYSCKNLICLEDGEQIAFEDGTMKLFLIDTELNRDSAILVKTADASFLNINDCKLMDRLPQIIAEEGHMDVFAAQYSGASWHPTCYAYSRKEYERISRRKVRSKFEAVARSLETVQPRIYMPTAGPPCFLDPDLIHLNFEKINIFPRSAEVVKFLGKRLGNSATQIVEVMPGDRYDVSSRTWTYTSSPRLGQVNEEQYIRNYAALYSTYFEQRTKNHTYNNAEEVYQKLAIDIRRKLEHFKCHAMVVIPLFFILKDAPNQLLRVDFPSKEVQSVARITETNFYSLTTHSWEIARIFDGKLTWEDFLLSLRFRLNREPDIYQTLIQGFLSLEVEDLDRFCEKVLANESNQERIVVEAGGTRYAINRYCPHDGGDLEKGWIAGKTIMCPRHRWVFDLENDGKCTTNDCSIHAFSLDQD